MNGHKKTIVGTVSEGHRENFALAIPDVIGLNVP